MKPMFVQGFVGQYTYEDKKGRLKEGHAIYALDDKGQVWKFVTNIHSWRPIEEIVDVHEEYGRKFINVYQ